MFESTDLAQLQEVGVSPEEVRRQVRLFEHPPAYVRLDRACTVGDGIRALADSEIDTALRRHEEARRAGRVLKFVPASGAATRMFQALSSVRNEAGDILLGELKRRMSRGDANAGEVVTFVENLERFAFSSDLRALLRPGLALPPAGEEVRAILDALLDPGGLDYAALPKGLIKFHRYPEGSRTAFEEHLVEGLEFVADDAGRCRVHLTVSPEHRGRFVELLERVRSDYERRSHTRLEVDFSIQKRSTDTLAVDLDNRPFRTSDGRLLFRPGGHGALIENLNDVRADLVQLQNIDNVVPDHLRGETTRWRCILAGHLVEVQGLLFSHLRALLENDRADEARLEAALGFVTGVLGLPAAGRLREGEAAVRRALLIELLDRPLRVCGVVRNTGEVGGGPFWVRGAGGTPTLQIVESAQVDPGSSEQKAIFAAATHFNPVQLVCAVSDWRGRPFDLRRFVDDEAVFIARKSKDGRDLKALERPGLWNGAMAFWNTIFIEVAQICFTPVKTVNDLLRPEHQPG
jgi:hypothetical protein